MDHELKCVNPWFQQVWEGSKPFEIRKLDRDFRAGDTLWLREYYPERRVLIDGDDYGDRCIKCRIRSIVKHNDFPEIIAPDYGVLGIEVLEKIENFSSYMFSEYV
jgi:hypothetical protein